jgi:hypothetical protein
MSGSASARRVIAIVFLWRVLGVASLEAQSTIRLGNELQVNSYTTSLQSLPSVAVEGDGDFVVAWESGLQDGDARAVVARRFNSAGVGQAAEFQVNTYTTGEQARPAIGIDATGNFVIAWSSLMQDQGSRGVFAQRFNAAGSRVAIEFQVNTYTEATQTQPSVKMVGDGRFVIVWESEHDGSGYGIFGQRFAASGAPQAGEFQINSHTALGQRRPVIAVGGDGDFVVGWASASQDGQNYGIFAQRFASSGTGLGAEFQVNVYTQGLQLFAEVAVDSDGDFVVIWQSNDGYPLGVFGRRFDSTGAALGGEFQVNTFTQYSQRIARIAMEPAGSFVVAWHSLQDYGGYGVFAQRFNSAGARQGAEFQVNTYSTDHQYYATVGSDNDGDFVVAWESKGQDGDVSGVFAQRFATLAILDIDGDGETAPLTDGLLVLRFLFGFSGTTLTAGAVDLAACSRCDAPTIQGYLQTLI